jgi:hypothetical protein
MRLLAPRPLARRDLLAGLTGTAIAPFVAGCSADEPPPPARPRTIEPNARPETVAAVSTSEGRGATVDRLFPTVRSSYRDPFVLLDDFRVAPPAGFPDHPHRGFEAFTYMLDGAFHHQDNLGNDSYVASGGVQLFTSGRGARHSEMPGEARPNRGLQLWVNLPRALKPMEPEYAAVQARDIPEVGARGVRTRTVVGPGSPVRVRTEMRYLDLAFERGARFADELASHLRGLVYVLDGRVKMGDVELAAGTAAIPVPGALELVALNDARVVLIAGRPHGEPIRHRGPFVD